MLLLSQKDNINPRRSRKSQTDFRFCSSSLYYRSLSQKFDYAQDDRLKGLLREPRTKVPSVMSLPLQISQSSLGNICTSHVQTLDHPPFKFFGSTFLERKVEKTKHKLTNNYPKRRRDNEDNIQPNECKCGYIAADVCCLGQIDNKCG